MGKKQTALVRDPIRKAHKRHVLPRSKTSQALLVAGRVLMPAYMQAVLRFRGVEIRKVDKAIAALRDFEEGRTRLIVAFRHPYGDESQLLFQAFNNLIPRAARRSGFRLRRRPHLRFLHDYAVPLWGDAFIRYMLPRIGAVPVYHVKFDSTSLKLIRGILLEDRYPLSLAPEGQVSYRSESLPRIEQGTVRMGFWTVKDLEKLGRPEHVKILLLSIHYHFDPRDEKKLWAVLDRLDRICGYNQSPVLAKFRTGPSTTIGLQRRVDALENRVLDIAEAYYAASYGLAVAPRPPVDDGDPDAAPAATVTSPEAVVARRARWVALMACALDTAEHVLGLVGTTPDGDRVQRIYRIRQECWDRIYPEQPVDGLSPLEIALAHRRTGEAWYAMRHMEFCDILYYLEPGYEQGRTGTGPSYDRIVEAVYSLDDLVSRLMGGDFSNRMNLIRKHAVIVAGDPIDLNDYNVKGEKVSRAACQKATDELKHRFEALIEESYEP